MGMFALANIFMTNCPFILKCFSVRLETRLEQASVCSKVWKCYHFWLSLQKLGLRMAVFLNNKSYLVDPASNICLSQRLSHACLSINNFIL